MINNNITVMEKDDGSTIFIMPKKIDQMDIARFANTIKANDKFTNVFGNTVLVIKPNQED